MKSIYVLLSLIFFNNLLSAQQTYIPDDNFEQALIDLGYDDAFDDYVFTSNISGIKTLNVPEQNISDLTGIEDFTALTHLNCNTNNLSSLDVTANNNLTNLYCHKNNLSNLNVSTNSKLIELYCYQNNLSDLDVGSSSALISLLCSANSLSSLDVSANTALQFLFCSGNNLNTLDVSSNTALITLACSNNNLSDLNLNTNTALEGLVCSENKLSSLDLAANIALKEMFCQSNNLNTLNIKNGSNTNLTAFRTMSNPNLECIQVDDADYMTINWSGGKDATASFSENCESLGVSDLESSSYRIYPNPVYDVLNIELTSDLKLKQVNIYDIQGQYLFSSKVQKINTKTLKSGLYFVEVETNKGKSVKRIIKE